MHELLLIKIYINLINAEIGWSSCFRFYQKSCLSDNLLPELSIYVNFDLNDPFALQNLVLEKKYFVLLGSSALTFLYLKYIEMARLPTLLPSNWTT